MIEVAKKDRARFVSRMFGRIAGRYDMGNRVLSLGRDQAWRRKAVALLDPAAEDLVLDVGAGTADLSLYLSERAGTVVAADFSLPMLEIGMRKARKAGRERNITFVVADALALPFADASFQVAATAFTVRNLARPIDGFREMHRVLKPGGRLVCLEFSRPTSRASGFFYCLYLNRVLPVIGGLISGDGKAYRYLAESIGDFSTPKELAETIRAAGFSRVEYRLLDLGTVAIHVARKDGTPTGAAP